MVVFIDSARCFQKLYALHHHYNTNLVNILKEKEKSLYRFHGDKRAEWISLSPAVCWPEKSSINFEKFQCNFFKQT